MVKNSIKAKGHVYEFSLRLTCPTLRAKTDSRVYVSTTRTAKHFPDWSYLVLLPAKLQITCSFGQLRAQRFELSTEGTSVSTNQLAACTERARCLYGIAHYVDGRGHCLHGRACYFYGRVRFLRNSSLFVRNSPQFAWNILLFVWKSSISTDRLYICTEWSSCSTEQACPLWVTAL